MMESIDIAVYNLAHESVCLSLPSLTHKPCSINTMSRSSSAVDEKTLQGIAAADPEQAITRGRITWQEDIRDFQHTRRLSRASLGQRRPNRESIRSARTRARQCQATLPIGFRTLSFQTSGSKEGGAFKEAHLASDSDSDGKTDLAKGFSKVDEHIVHVDTL
jgi:hypothetical protein